MKFGEISISTIGSQSEFPPPMIFGDFVSGKRSMIFRVISQGKSFGEPINDFPRIIIPAKSAKIARSRASHDMSSEIKSLKIYVPAKDLQESKRFYEALGFSLTEAWGGNFDCRLGAALFRLQNYFVKDWADNFMMQFEVDNASAWYEHARKVIEAGGFDKSVRAKPPEEVEPGVYITYVHDPCGVLLIFIQLSS